MGVYQLPILELGRFSHSSQNNADLGLRSQEPYRIKGVRHAVQENKGRKSWVCSLSLYQNTEVMSFAKERGLFGPLLLEAQELCPGFCSAPGRKVAQPSVQSGEEGKTKRPDSLLS